MRINTGPLQPWPVRQVTTPCPYCAPKIKAPFKSVGTIATQVAEAKMLVGMVASCAAIMSSSVVLAESSRFCKSSREEAQQLALAAKASTKQRQSETKFFFIGNSFLLRGHQSRGRGKDCGRQSAFSALF